MKGPLIRGGLRPQLGTTGLKTPRQAMGTHHPIVKLPNRIPASISVKKGR